jgi:hypothetical protein
VLRDKRTGRFTSDKRFGKEPSGIWNSRKLAKKICYACGSTTTRIFNRKNIGPHNPWFYNYDRDNNVLCFSCYRKFISYPITLARTRGKRLHFRGREIYLSENPKTGTCQVCNRSISKDEIKKTDMHHEEYDDNDPLAHTIELCVNCHNHRHPERYRR